jgi:hypothetical protein
MKPRLSTMLTALFVVLGLVLLLSPGKAISYYKA